MLPVTEAVRTVASDSGSGWGLVVVVVASDVVVLATVVGVTRTVVVVTPDETLSVLSGEPPNGKPARRAPMEMAATKISAKGTDRRTR